MESKEHQIASLVNGLRDQEARKQLHLAYRHMERCLRALRGEDVHPAGMMDTEDSIAEELFWQCVRCANEMDYQSDDVDECVFIPAEIEFFSTCDLLIHNYGSKREGCDTLRQGREGRELQIMEEQDEDDRLS